MGTLRNPNFNFPVSGLAAVIATGMLLFFNYNLSKVYIPTKIPDRQQPVDIPYEKTPEPVDLVDPEVITQQPVTQTKRNNPADQTNKPVNILPIPSRDMSIPEDVKMTKLIQGKYAPIPHTPEWFTPDQVEHRPRVLKPVTPVYPFQATVSGIEGRVVLRFIVDENGEVQNPVVIKAEPEGVFEEAALAAIAKYKFIPATIGKRKVKCIAVMPVGFKIN